MVQFTGKQCIRNYRDHSEERVNENFRIKIGFITFIREATKQDSNIANNSRGEWVYIRTIQGHTDGMAIMPELIGYVSIPYNWKEFIFHRGCSCDHWSITETGLVAGGKESKFGRQTIFFILVNPPGSDKNEEGQVVKSYCSIIFSRN